MGEGTSRSDSFRRGSAVDDAVCGVVVERLFAGDFCGEVEILLEKKAIASVRAATRCHVLLLPRAAYHRALSAHPAAAAEILNVARERYERHHPGMSFQ